MRLEIKYGLIGSAAFIAWEMGEYLLGFHTTNLTAGLFVAIFSIFVPFFVTFFGILEKRKQNPYQQLSLKDGLRSGLMIALIMALVTGAFYYVYLTQINPDFIETKTEFLRKIQYDRLLAEGAAEGPEQARRLSMERVTTMSNGRTALYYSSMRLSNGFLVSLLVSLVLRTKNNISLEDEDEEDEEEEDFE